jgi:O-antigen/teichoic acid export membrane protein
VSERSLTQRSFSAAVWSLAFQFLGRLVTPVIGVLLARRLSPSDYGLIGMLGIFWAVGAIFTDGGFGIALLRKKDPDPIEYDSVFGYNVGLGLVIYLLLALGAPWIAAFYRQPALIPIVRVTGLTFLVGPFCSIPSLLLQKRLEHRVLSAVHISGSVLSGGIAIGLAYRGYGVWALVGQQLFSLSFTAVALSLHTRWHPRGKFSLAALKRLFGFSSGVMMTHLLNAIFNNLHSVIIGRLYSPQQVGYFTRGNAYAGLWANSLFSTVESVTFPAYAEIQEDRDRLRKAVRRSLILTTVVCAFPTALFAFLARPVVRLLLTARWEPMVPFLWILAGVHILTLFQAFYAQVEMTCGRSDLHLRIALFKRVMTLVAILLTFRLSAIAMAAGLLIVSLICTPVSGYYSRRLIGYSFRQQWADMAETLGVSLCAGLAAGGANAFLEMIGFPSWVGILGGGMIGIAVFLVLLLVRKKILAVGLDLLVTLYPSLASRPLFRWLRGRIQGRSDEMLISK